MDEKYLKLSEAITEGEAEEAAEESMKLIESGVEVAEIFSDCVEPTLNVIGDQFAKLEVFLPELLMASEAVKAVQAEIEPILKANPIEGKVEKRAVIATVYGDLHDIGMNIVAVMLEVNGFKVKNLGTDVSSNDIIQAACDYDAELVCLSGLMMPSMPYMRDTIERIKGDAKHQNRFKILVGGGPVSEDWANKSGADGYADDAIGAVAEALRVSGLEASA
jgi:methanogenic corrinoid protein MtbC1